MDHLGALLKAEFLTDEKAGTKFVAWNGNRFDAVFVAAALITDDTYRLRPYMTKSKTLRGLRVELAFDDEGNELDPKTAPAWEFLDGIAMLGLVGVSLDKLLKNFAPDYQQMTGIIDFEREQFDPKNPQHREYAMRDSEGLYHAMTRAQNILIETFNQPLTVTMGGACIKILQAHLPKDKVITALIPDVDAIVRQFVMRGGFCFHVRRYEGPIWKYDINQAYAAAMREAALPAGAAIRMGVSVRSLKFPFIARITATNPANRVPFYHRINDAGRVRAVFSTAEIRDAWVTSIEFQQLQAEGWNIIEHESWAWPDSFNLREYVDKLEVRRMTCEGGPSGPIGTMLKAVGNHSYGKTVERIEPVEYVIAAECPDDCLPFYGDGATPLAHVFYRIDEERKPKDYHQPQLGAFITAHVRMVLRRVALLCPEGWLYADTDCVVFDRDITAQIDIDAKRYGAWKIEENGAHYQMIAKKVYAQTEIEDDSIFIGPPNPFHKRSAKGLNVRKLTPQDFTAWLNGEPPEQDQVQNNNFLSVLCGAEMYRAQKRKGTSVEAKTSAKKARSQ